MLVLVLVSVLVGGAVLTIAVFTGSSTNTAAVSAGSVVFDLTPSTVIVDTTGLRPGDTRTGQVQLTNRSSPATFTLGFGGLGTGQLAGVLQLTVSEVTPVARQLYSGSLASVQTITLGRIATGTALTLGLTFAWPSAGNGAALQGQSVPLVLQWNATT